MDEWKLAIDHELVTTLQTTADSFDSPKEAIQALINWHIEVNWHMEVEKYFMAQAKGEQECQHCGWTCRPNDNQSKMWYALEQK